jgi:ubiquinone/menaquinone biosynthesis C-methylase UbiE
METNALRSHYDSDVAGAYDESRRHNPKWVAEQRAVEGILDDFPSGAMVLDVPVGTGRFLEYYARRGFVVLGIDSSEDMLRQAGKRDDIDHASMTLRVGDIFRLDVQSAHVDVAVCIRFMNLVSTESMRSALMELGRVSRRGVIVGIRHLVPRSELRLWHPSGLRRLLGRIVSRVRHGMQGKVVFHPRSDVQAAVAAAGLVVSRSVCIEQRGDGTDYYIYLLGKK